MPSAASIKLEKQQSSNAKNAAEVVDDNSSPIRQVIMIFEHKIRNLEKRKVKLESYRDIEKSGKPLNEDQKTALSKFDVVAQTLEFVREISKQIAPIAAGAEKEMKKKQKKDETIKKQAEIAKVREVLIMQDILRLMNEDCARDDFLNGTNGACKLEEAELELLDKFAMEIVPKRPGAPDVIPFTRAVQKCADHLSQVIDYKSKPFGQSTYMDVRNIFLNIQKCGYFDKASLPPPVISDELVSDVDPMSATQQTSNELIVDEKNPLIVEQDPSVIPIATGMQQNSAVSIQAANIEKVIAQDFQEAPAATAVPVPTFPPQQQQQQPQQIVSVQQQPPPPQMLQQIPIVPVVAIPNVVQASAVQTGPGGKPIHPSHMAATTVRAVEQAYFKQHQYMQQMRPLAEVIGTGNFFFLQDSELDSPDIMPGYPPQQQTTVPPQISPNGMPQQLPQSIPQQPSAPQSQQQQMIQPSQQQQMVQTPQQVITATAVPPQQIPTQTFTNQSFPATIVPGPTTAPQIFPTIKSNDVSQQHIPGFATPNAPIPIPVVQQQPIVSQHQHHHQQNIVTTGAQQQLHSGAPPQQQANTVMPMTVYSSSGKFPPVNSVPNNIDAANIQQQIKQHTPPKESRSSQLTNIDSGKINNNSQDVPVEQRVPEISEWKPEDATKPPITSTSSAMANEEITEWRDPYETPEISDWNEDTQDTSNEWSSSNQSSRYNYRGGSGYNNRNRGPSGRTGGGGGGGGGGGSSSNGGGYRGGRSNNYQNNRQTSGGSGGGGGSTGGNTFYRNNDNYYQSQNGSGGGGGGGGYRGSSDNKDSGYNKSDGGYRGNNNYRSRDTRGGTSSTTGDNNNTNGSGPMRNSRTSRHNSNSAERGQNSRSLPQNSNNNNRTMGGGGGGSGSGGNNAGGGQNTNSRTNLSTNNNNKSHMYGGGSRSSGNTGRSQATANV